MNQESMTFLLDRDKKMALLAIASTTKNTIEVENVFAKLTHGN